MSGSHTTTAFATIEQAIEEIRQGKMIVVCDDEDRENEDLAEPVAPANDVSVTV